MVNFLDDILQQNRCTLEIRFERGAILNDRGWRNGNRTVVRFSGNAFRIRQVLVGRLSRYPHPQKYICFFKIFFKRLYIYKRVHAVISMFCRLIVASV